MARLLPGTRALRTLEAAARHLNFTRAADELGLTPAAVSHQIKEIEDQLGMVLFTRTSRTIRLTEAGTVLFEASTDALDLLSRAVSRARKLARGTALLKVTLDAQFASKWLMRRVDDFRKRQPDIELRFDIAYEVRDFDLDDVDVGIRFGAGKYPGCRAHRLFDNVIIPVCSPSLLRSGPPLQRAARSLQPHACPYRMVAAGRDLAELADVDGGGRRRRFRRQPDRRLRQLAPMPSRRRSTAMPWRSPISPWWQTTFPQGRLVQPFELGIRVAPEFAYFLVYPESTADDPRIVAFREWILEEVAQDSRPGRRCCDELGAAVGTLRPAAAAAEPADHRADDQQHAEPVAAVDEGQVPAEIFIAMVDRQRRGDEAQPEARSRRPAPATRVGSPPVIAPTTRAMTRP